MAQIKQLSVDQLADFNGEYLRPEAVQTLLDLIAERFSGGKIRILDVGGGNGVFMDRLLDALPSATGVVLDNADSLLQKNTRRERKQTVRCSVEDIDSALPGEKFELICLNFVLHHFVLVSYRKTTEYVHESLRALARHLTGNGRISIFENMYDGRFFDNLPSHLIYHLASTRFLRPLAKLGGANTAGVGACFRSHRDWARRLEASGLEIEAYRDVDRRFQQNTLVRTALHLGDTRVGHFWVK